MENSRSCFGNPIPDKATKLLEAGKFKIECLQKSKQTKFGKARIKVKVKNQDIDITVIHGCSCWLGARQMASIVCFL